MHDERPISQNQAGANGKSTEESPRRQSGHMARCARCGEENTPQHKFCGHCGAALWEPCVECAARVSPAEIYCGHCGTNTVEALRQRSTRLQSGLQQAEKLLEGYLYEDAGSVLSPLVEESHPRLAPLVEQAKQMLARLEEDQQEQQQGAGAAYEAAQMYVSDKDYQRAKRALESVPPPFRSEEMSALLAEVEQINEEIATLTQQIRQMLSQKQLRGLLPKVERLVELQPANQDAKKLLGRLEKLDREDHARLRDRLCRSAKESLRQHDYDHAVEQLKLVPDSVRSEDFQKLNDHAVELQWLMDDLRTAPIVDQNLLAIGERLIKLQPQHAKAVELVEELRRRSGSRPKDRRLAAVPWTKAPKRSYVGCEVEWIGYFRQLAVSGDDVQQVLLAHPGRFFVSAGLALQAMGRARLQVNLLPQERTGLMSMLKLPQKRQDLKPAAAGWGIDIGPTSLKATRLVWKEGENAAEVASCTLIPHEKNLGRPDAEWSRYELIQQTLKKFLAEVKPDLRRERVCIGMPGGKVLSRFCHLPPVKKTKLHDAAMYEAQHQIPLPLESLLWDYQLMQGAEAGLDEDETLSMVLVAAQESDVRTYVQPLRDLEIRVDALQSDCLALYNYLAYDYFSEHGQHAEPDLVGLLDLGSDTANLIIGSPQTVWFRTIARGADEFTHHLMRAFNLTFDKAERLKRQPSLARRLSKLHSVLERPFEDLVNEIQLSFRSYQMVDDDHERQLPGKVMLCGGGMHTHGLQRYLQLGK